MPVLNVEEIDLEVENLTAHVSVRADLADFVNINIGGDAHLDKVKLVAKGIEAQVQLKVRLDRILGTIDRALSALEQNPGLLDAPHETEVCKEIEGSAGTPGEIAQDTGDESGVEATDAARRKARSSTWTSPPWKAPDSVAASFRDVQGAAR